MGAWGPRNADWVAELGTSDPYSQVRVEAKAPFWQEEAVFTDEIDSREVTVWDLSKC